MTDEPAADAAATSWRELAVARSLDPARTRAEKRVQRFLDAALELLASSSEFTVQEVVERSGQSLRSFYQYFAGKYELLLALFEEAVRSTAERLEQVIAESDDPLERLHRFAVEYHRICRPVGTEKAAKRRAAPPLADFAQQLLTEHPAEASRAYAPLVTLLVGLLDDVAAAGAIRGGLDHRRVAGVLLQAISFHPFAATISGQPARSDRADGEELWGLLFHGIGPEPAA